MWKDLVLCISSIEQMTLNIKKQCIEKFQMEFPHKNIQKGNFTVGSQQNCQRNTQRRTFFRLHVFSGQ